MQRDFESKLGVFRSGLAAMLKNSGFVESVLGFNLNF